MPTTNYSYGSLDSQERTKCRRDADENNDAQQKHRSWPSPMVLCAALNSCNLGYDVGVSTSVGRLVQQDLDLTRWEREVFVGSLNFWASFGSLAAQYVSDVYGRRCTFLVSAVGFVLGLVVTAMGNTYEVLLAGRALVGLGVGVGLAIDSMYIGEISPAEHRGELVTWAEVAINIGIVIGFSTDLWLAPLPLSQEWRAMLLLGCIFPIGMMVVIFLGIMPESPRWLIQHGFSEAAEDVLCRIYLDDNRQQIAARRRTIEASITQEQEGMGWAAILLHPTPGVRRMLMVGVGIVVAQQAVGIDAIQYYLLDVLAQSGIESVETRGIILVSLGILKLFTAWLGGQLFDRQGRRKLLSLSLLGMIAALLLLAFSFSEYAHGWNSSVTIWGLALYIAMFSIGMGPGGWLIGSEVYSIGIRAKAVSIGTFLNRITATIMATTFLSTAHAVGWPWFFLLLCSICCVTLAFVHAFLPETKGKSLEEMSEHFAAITGDRSTVETCNSLQAVP